MPLPAVSWREKSGVVGGSEICRILPFCVIRSAGKTEIHQPGPGFALSRPAVLLPNIALCSAGSNFSLHFRILGVWAVPFRFQMCWFQQKKIVLPSSAQVLSMSLQIRDAFNQSDRRRLLGGYYFDCVGRTLRPKSSR